MTARPEYDLEPLEPLDAAEEREARVSEARSEADRYRALNAARERWSPADSRRLLRELAEREGETWVEADSRARGPQPDRPTAERSCLQCGASYTPGSPTARYCGQRCVYDARAAREKAKRAEARAKRAAG